MKTASEYRTMPEACFQWAHEATRKEVRECTADPHGAAKEAEQSGIGNERDAASRQCSPSCTTSHNHPVTA